MASLAPRTPWHNGKIYTSHHPLRAVWKWTVTCKGSPASVTHEGFQVQIHRDIFGRCNWDADGAGEVVNAGVDHVAFPEKNALCKNQYRSDDGVCREERKRQFRNHTPGRHRYLQTPAANDVLPFEVEMHNSAWAAWVSFPRLTERAVWSFVLAGITPRCPSASFSGLLNSAYETSPNSELMSILNNTAILLHQTHCSKSYYIIWCFGIQKTLLISAPRSTWPFLSKNTHVPSAFRVHCTPSCLLHILYCSFKITKLT